MAKFGALIDGNTPALLVFYAEWNEASTTLQPVLGNVAAAVGNTAKVIKIDVDKNKELSQALHIKELPTLILYKKGEMVWRQSGAQDTDTLIGIVNAHV